MWGEHQTVINLTIDGEDMTEFVYTMVKHTDGCRSCQIDSQVIPQHLGCPKSLLQMRHSSKEGFFSFVNQSSALQMSACYLPNRVAYPLVSHLLQSISVRLNQKKEELKNM